MSPLRTLLRRLAAPLVVGAAALALSACGTNPTDAAPAGTAAQEDRPMGHIHGVGRDPETGDVVVATHSGLFRLDATGPTPVGPVLDLMGFTVAADGSYLASGHPGTASDLPEPLGLVRSTDGGATWTQVSRGGESDFHGLTAGDGLVAGFDGDLLVSEDGTDWTPVSVPGSPHFLAASPSGTRLLVTSPEGLLSTVDRGATWETLETPELLVAVDWADDETVVGVGVSGRLVRSDDAGETWTVGSEPVGEVSAVHGTRTAGTVEILAVLHDGVVSTTDLGSTTERVL